ncbi:MAG: peptidoglycan-binding protein [Armatimonadota bacterium]|nr:peptidoglycan-binding protein [Armatimonadota bacterium]
MARIHYSMAGRWFVVMMLAGVLAQSANAAPPREWPELEAGNSEVSVEARVKALQYLLRARGQKVVVDGKFGTQTVRAVKNFQRRHRLIADGVVGNATWEVLIVKVKSGSKGNAVRAAQTLLKHQGYDVPVDGIFGAQTKAAVLKFQSRTGRTKDGIVGPYTWCELVGGTVGQVIGD